MMLAAPAVLCLVRSRHVVQLLEAHDHSQHHGSAAVLCCGSTCHNTAHQQKCLSNAEASAKQSRAASALLRSGWPPVGCCCLEVLRVSRTTRNAVEQWRHIRHHWFPSWHFFCTATNDHMVPRASLQYNPMYSAPAFFQTRNGTVRYGTIATVQVLYSSMPHLRQSITWHTRLLCAQSHSVSG